MKPHFLNPLLATIVPVIAALSLHAAEERQLVAVLQSPAGVPEKAAACQQLRIHGTAASVPALAALLADDRLGQAARYALEGMEAPEAGAALRDSLAGASGLLKAGIIDSLGWRHDEAALPLLVPLLSKPDELIAAATARALGRIGGDSAVEALEGARHQAAATGQPAIGEALLQCAERRLAEGDMSGAARIHAGLLERGTPAALRVAAWRGFAAGDAGRAGMVTEALGSSDHALQAAALGLLRESSDPDLLRSCIQQWQHLPAVAQTAVLETQLRCGADVPPTLRLASRSPEASVRIAAWQALAETGDPSLLPELTGAAANGEAGEQQAARDALARLRGDGVGDAFVALLGSSQPADQAELLRALGRRGDPAAAGVLLDYATAEPAMVRLAALDSLALLAVPATLTPLLDLSASTAADGDRDAVLKALHALCQSSPDKEQATLEVNAALSHFSTDQQCRVLPLLADLATPAAMKKLQALARGGDLESSKEAVRVLAKWPDATPSEFLLPLASSTADPSLRALALRGAVATAGLRDDPAARLELLRQALSLAAQPQEKMLVLGQLGRIPSREALDLALSCLDDPALVNEAALAAISVAEPLAKDDPALADAAATAVLAKCQLPAIAQRARALHPGPAAAGPFIRDWLVSGPYRQAGAVGALAVFDPAFGPETAAGDVKWHAAPVGDSVNLAGLFPGQDNCVAYLKAEITTPAATDAQLLMGSDDGLKVWLNGALVHGNNIDRGQVADQDMAPVRLRAGANELLMKVTQGGGGWSACARIVAGDGRPIEGLRVKPQSDAPPVSRSQSEKP